MSGPGQSGWGAEPGGAYVGPPSHGGQQPGFGGPPSYGHQPGYGDGAGYGGQPGYGGGAGYGGQPVHGAQPAHGGGYGGPGGYGTPPPPRSTTTRNVVIAVVAVIVLVGGGLGIAAAAGAFSGDAKTVAGPTTTAPSTSDFGTGSPTAGSSGSSGSSESESSSTDDPSASPTGDYDSTAPSESDARDTMGAFWGAAADGDVDTAVGYVCPEYRSEFETELGEDDSESGFDIDFDNSSYLGTDTEGGARSLEYDLKLTLADGSSAEVDYTAVLRSLDGDVLLCGRTIEER